MLYCVSKSSFKYWERIWCDVFVQKTYYTVVQFLWRYRFSTRHFRRTLRLVNFAPLNFLQIDYSDSLGFAIDSLAVLARVYFFFKRLFTADSSIITENYSNFSWADEGLGELKLPRHIADEFIILVVILKIIWSIKWNTVFKKGWGRFQDFLSTMIITPALITPFIFQFKPCVFRCP